MIELEDLGRLFRGDPTFDFIFNNMTNGQFMKIAELRRKRLEQNPQLSDILPQ